MNRDPFRPISDLDINTFASDGVLCLRQLFDADWVAYLLEAVEADLNSPGTLHNDITRDGTGSFRSDTFVWANIPAFRKFMTDSPAPQVAAAIMASASESVKQTGFSINKCFPASSAASPILVFGSP